MCCISGHMHTHLRTEADWLFCSKVLVVHLHPHLCKPVLQPWQNSTSMQLMDANISVLLAQTLNTLYQVEVTTTASSTQNLRFILSILDLLGKLPDGALICKFPSNQASHESIFIKKHSSAEVFIWKEAQEYQPDHIENKPEENNRIIPCMCLVRYTSLPHSYPNGLPRFRITVAIFLDC